MRLAACFGAATANPTRKSPGWMHLATNTYLISSPKESIRMIRGLSTTVFIRKTFTASLPKLRSSRRWSESNVRRWNKKTWAPTALNFEIRRYCVLRSFLSSRAQWPNDPKSGDWSTDIVSSSPSFTLVSKKLPLRDPLKLIYRPWLLPLYPCPDEQLLQLWLVELGNKCPLFKDYSYKRPCIDWAPSRHVKECHWLCPIRAASHPGFHRKAIKCNIPGCHSRVIFC